MMLQRLISWRARVARQVLFYEQEARVARKRPKPEGAAVGVKKVLFYEQEARVLA